MSMGNSNYNNNERRNNYPTVYSNFKMSNPEADQPTQLSFAFSFNGLLKFIIAPKKGVTQDGYVSYDHEAEVFAYISYTKAKLLSFEIDRLINGEVNSVGVDTKHGILNIAKEGEDDYILTIADIDPDTGLISGSMSYVLKKNTRSINNYNYSNGQFDIKEYPDIELIMIKDLLDEYYKSTTNAVAYSVINANRFNEERTKNSLEAIKKQLNIPTSGQYSSKPSGGQYFNKPQTPSQQTNFDDLETRLEDLE